MQTTVITISAHQITDWESFHTVFQTALGFPAFYGRNMNAWIDCMRSIERPEDGMSDITVHPGELLALRVDDADALQRRCPDQYNALIECTAFVNYARIEAGTQPVLALLLGGKF